MEVDLDSNVIKATQTSLGKYVKRPPLSEKLLKKPPFRFIHDIVTSVLKSTGFFNGLFEENELISENVKDREAKVAFLNKVIFVIGQTTGKKLLVKPSKIVAGQEPEKTNELLQCLAQALDKKLTSDEAVKNFKQQKEILNERKGTKDVKIDDKKLLTKTKDPPTKIDKNSINKSKVKENVKVRKETPPKNISQKSKAKTTDKQSNKTTIESKREHTTTDLKQSINDINPNINELNNIEKEDSNDANVIVERNIEKGNSIDESRSVISDSQISIATSATSRAPSPKSNELTEINDTNNEKTGENNITEISPANTLKETKEKVAQNAVELIKEPLESDSQKHLQQTSPNIDKNSLPNVDNFSKRPSSARPTSSRPSAPRFREKHDNIPNNNINIIPKVNIISENVVPEEDEEASIVIQNSTELDEIPQIENGSTNQHGHLVQQILDSQKEFSNASGKTEIEWQFEAQKTRDDVNKDIEQLRFNIQALSRIANPLGKLLDHIQEDVEIMRQESFQWIQTYEETSKELTKQKALNEESLVPLQAKIKQLESEIIEKHEKINDLKIIVHKNKARIEKLLTNGIVQ